MLRTQRTLRLLGPADLAETVALAGRSPVVNVFADYRARITRLETRLLGGEMWGYHEDGVLVAACHAAANLVPVQASPEAVEQFAAHAARQGRRCATIVGPRSAVEPMWDVLRRHWSPPREVRWAQPHLEISGPPACEPDPAVRRTTPGDLEVLYPACVAMYTEEVGVSPEAGGGRAMYRTRVSQLVHRGWSYARVEDGRVLFKAEVAAATPHAAQIQGVYVDPDHRGEGLAAHGMAAVVEIVRREVAPVVSLYVNDHNVAARAAYARAGFEQSDEFTTIMF